MFLLAILVVTLTANTLITYVIAMAHINVTITTLHAEVHFVKDGIVGQVPKAAARDAITELVCNSKCHVVVLHYVMVNVDYITVVAITIIIAEMKLVIIVDRNTRVRRTAIATVSNYLNHHT